MFMDNSAFPDTCRDSHKDVFDHHDLIENFPPFETFCSKNENLDTLQNNSPRYTDCNGT
jgi:hypothetical protein